MLTWPIAGHLDDQALGNATGGVWQAIWLQAATAQALTHHQGWPLYTDLIGFPVPTRVLSAAPLHDLLGLPVHALFGPVVAYNIVMLGHLVWAFLGAFALARGSRMSTEGALAAATVFGLNPLLWSTGVASGAPVGVGMAWLPWLLAAMLALIRRPRALTAIATAASALALALADLQLAVFTALLIPLVALPAIWEQIREDSALKHLRGMLWALTGLALAVGLGTIAARLQLSLAADPLAMVQPGSMQVRPLPSAAQITALGHEFGTLEGILLPGKSRLLVHDDMIRSAQAMYAGWVALGLASFGVARGRLRWLALGGVAVVLSMGPYLLVTLDAARPAPIWWWISIRSALPVFTAMGSYTHALALAFVSLALLAGWGLEAGVRRGASPRWRAITAALGLLAIVAEFALLSPVPLPTPIAKATIPETARMLQALPIPGAVLDWPQRLPDGRLQVGSYLFDQIIHGRPIPYGLSPDPNRAHIEANPFYAQLEQVSYGEDYHSDAWSDVSSWPPLLGVETLGSMGFAYLVLHPQLLEQSRREAVVLWLQSNLQLVAQAGDDGMIFAFPRSGP